MYHPLFFWTLKPRQMPLSIPTCTETVDGQFVKCPACKLVPVKNGFSASGKQRYRCNICRKSFLLHYQKPAYYYHVNNSIRQLLKEGCGIRSISRLIGICKDTVISRIKCIAKRLSKPPVAFGKSYEMDELRTFIQNKDAPIWVAYAIRKDTGEVVDFRIGNRSNRVLSGVVNTLLLSNAKMIHTDKLINYRTLVPSAIHKTKVYGTNHIERKNLTLRTHLKRLSRRSICFSKSKTMLEACLKLYFWG